MAVNLREIEETWVVRSDNTFFSCMTITLHLSNQMRELGRFRTVNTPAAWFQAEPRQRDPWLHDVVTRSAVSYVNHNNNQQPHSVQSNLQVHHYAKLLQAGDELIVRRKLGRAIQWAEPQERGLC